MGKKRSERLGFSPRERTKLTPPKTKRAVSSCSSLLSDVNLPTPLRFLDNIFNDGADIDEDIFEALVDDGRGIDCADDKDVSVIDPLSVPTIPKLTETTPFTLENVPAKLFGSKFKSFVPVAAIRVDGGRQIGSSSPQVLNDAEETSLFGPGGYISESIPVYGKQFNKPGKKPNNCGEYEYVSE